MLIKDLLFEPITYFRKGILLTIENQNGEKALAEISPLPGYSQESLDDALSQLTFLKKQIMMTWWTKEALIYLESWNLYPSVFFGIQSALLDLLDPVQQPSECRSYALLMGTFEEILERVKEVKTHGQTKAKIKLGHFTPDKAKEIVHLLKDDFELRIDLNRRWTLDESLDFCSDFPQNFFKYIEEPCSNPEDLPHFPYPFALDETLRDSYDLNLFLPLKHCTTLILKPTLMYPIDQFLNLGKTVVITSSFEGSIGIKQIKNLIIRLGLEKIPNGLNTHEMSHCILEQAQL